MVLVVHSGMSSQGRVLGFKAGLVTDKTCLLDVDFADLLSLTHSRSSWSVFQAWFVIWCIIQIDAH